MEDQRILERITQLRLQFGWSEYILSKTCDVPQSTISSWYNKSVHPSIDSLNKISKGFGMTLSQLVDLDDEILDLTDDQKELIKMWNLLSPLQKEKVMIFISGMLVDK